MFRIMRLWIFWVTVYLSCVSEIFTLPPYEPYKILFQNDKGTMSYYKDNSLSIYCSNSQIRMTDAFQPINISINFIGVYLTQCLVLSNTTIVDEFESLNIKTATLEYLVYSFSVDKPLPPGNYTEGLNITRLMLPSENYRYIFKNTQKFLDPLTNLKFLYVDNVEIPPLPTTMNLINLSLSNGATIKAWGNCHYMEGFGISGLNEESFPIWPANCTRLQYLALERILPETTLMVARRMSAAIPSLRTLKITNCGLHSLPIELLRSAKNLVHLDLSGNAFYDEVLQSFPYLTSLKTLDLNNNLLREYRSKIGCMEGSILKNNFMIPLQNSSMESIALSHSTVHLNCFKDIRFLNMKNIFLVHPPGSDKFEHSSIPYNNGRNLTVTRILITHVNCDCKHGWLARALRDFPHIISMPTLKCDHKYGIEILQVPPEHLECEKMEHDDGCIYRRSWSDGKVTAECKIKDWTEMEFMYPLYGLNVSERGITTLPSKLSDNIQWLDLRRNSISSGNAEEAAALFSAGRRVWLSDNLLLCDCDNRALLDAIQLHRKQVPDYELLKCVGTDKSLSLVSTDVLCQVPMIASLIACSVLIVIAGLIALLFRQYGENLRMFLYSRGLCIRCLQRQDTDDKPYDAFLSFAHEDQEYVTETLLPGLENAPEQFRICVHYRDWPIGDWIPSQIMRSVQLSKRTLILLSRNFANSAWSKLELRCALANAAEDPHAKVLVLIKDDVLDTNLDMELRGYLTLNTYLCCDDPWFWEKLRYAMPHMLEQKT